nr:unnamed protein product [Callosobruchus chinensis]
MYLLLSSTCKIYQKKKLALFSLEWRHIPFAYRTKLDLVLHSTSPQTGAERLTENFGPLRWRPPIRIVFGKGLPGPEGVQDHFVDGELVRLAGFPGIQRGGTRAHQEAQRGRRDAEKAVRGRRRRDGRGGRGARARHPGARRSRPTAHRRLTDRDRRWLAAAGGWRWRVCTPPLEGVATGNFSFTIFTSHPSRKKEVSRGTWHNTRKKKLSIPEF